MKHLKLFEEFKTNLKNHIVNIKNLIDISYEEKFNLIKRYYLDYYSYFIKNVLKKEIEPSSIDSDKTIKIKFINFLKDVDNGKFFYSNVFKKGLQRISRLAKYADEIESRKYNYSKDYTEPLFLKLKYVRDVKPNEVLIHYTTDEFAKTIKNTESFKGINYENFRSIWDSKWSLSKDRGSFKDGYGFAYLKNSKEKQLAKGNTYLEFQCKAISILVFHKKDNEYQVIFDSKKIDYSSMKIINKI